MVVKQGFGGSSVAFNIISSTEIEILNYFTAYTDSRKGIGVTLSNITNPSTT